MYCSAFYEAVVNRAIDFYIKGLNFLLAERTPTPYKIKVNWLIWGCESSSLGQFYSHDSKIFWQILRSMFAYVFIFGNMFPERHGFVAMHVTSCIKGTCSNLSHSIYIKLVKGDLLYDLLTGTATNPWLRKYVTKYKKMRKSMVEFLKKYESRGYKIARVNSIRIRKSINFL